MVLATILIGNSTAFAESLLLTSGGIVLGVVDRRDNITRSSQSTLARTATFQFSYSHPAVSGSS
jgi:hypothetical protein